MFNTILSMCGTSLLTNGASEETRKLLTRHANDVTLPADVAPTISSWIALREAAIETADLDTIARWSAELNGILAFYDRNPSATDKSRDMHYLLASDTHIGRETRSLVTRWLEIQGFRNIVPIDVSGLNTRSLDDFRLATHDLIEIVQEQIHAARGPSTKVYFNLTGGFKSVNALLQTLGALWADEVFFIFDGETSIIRIPKLPLTLDFDIDIESNLPFLRQMRNDVAVKADALSGFPNALLMFIGDEAQLSTWAEASLAPRMKAIYSQKVHPAWHPRIRFGPDFLPSVRNEQPDRVYLLNQRIDDLCRFAATGHNPHRLDLKELRGNPMPGSTHECDAWADCGAKRMFLHREGDAWVIDRLGKHL